MPRFQYVALDIDGREKIGGIDALNEGAARQSLHKRKLLPVRLVADHAAPRAGEAKVSARGALSHKSRLIITRQLATLIDATVPVDEALTMIAAQQENANARRIVEGVRDGVVEGMRLADAMRRHPKSFDSLYRAAVSGGERSGKLGFVLTRLADYLTRAHAIRSKVGAAMVYPAALSCVAIVVVCCLMIFVVPSLAQQFESFDAQLPLLTQILIGTSAILSTYWALLLLALAGGVLALRMLLRRPAVREAFDGSLLRAPFLGKWVRAVGASRFVRAVATLVASGLPVLESVRLAQSAVGNRAFATATARMGDAIEEGEQLSHTMRASGVFPPMVAYMTASGENAGELGPMLEKAADHLDQEVESFTTSAIALLEPAIIVFMGVVVACIVLAIMLPVLQLNTLAVG